LTKEFICSKQKINLKFNGFSQCFSFITRIHDYVKYFVVEVIKIKIFEIWTFNDNLHAFTCEAKIFLICNNFDISRSPLLRPYLMVDRINYDVKCIICLGNMTFKQFFVSSVTFRTFPPQMTSKKPVDIFPRFKGISFTFFKFNHFQGFDGNLPLHFSDRYRLENSKLMPDIERKNAEVKR